MSAVPKSKLTAVEYLAIERRAEYKSEFFRGEMFAMAGARYEHNRINDNLVFELTQRFKGGKCQAISSDMRVKIEATELYTYPDVLIVCGKLQFEDEARDTLLNPDVIFEILSPTTEKYDRGTKFRHYQQIPSLKEIVLVTTEEPICERFTRQPDGTWLLTTSTGLTSELALVAVPTKIPLADIYAGVTFPETPLR